MCKEGPSKCIYPIWVPTRLKIKKPSDTSNNKPNTNKEDNIYMDVPFTKGISKSFKNICSKHVYKYTSKEAITSRTYQWPPSTWKSGLIYKYKCDMTIDENLKMTSKTLLQIQPSNITDNNTSLGNLSIIWREAQNLTRTTTGVTFIRVNDPFLNRSIGQYQLPHIWDEILFNILEITLHKYKQPFNGLDLCALLCYLPTEGALVCRS